MIAAYESGTILRERYRLTNIVGQGGMGNVYRAEDLRLPGRLCAVKEVRPDPLASPEEHIQAREQFLQEASILAQLDHPNLPKVSDYFTEGGNEYLVMDYVPGDDLHKVLRASREAERKLDEETVLTWARPPQPSPSTVAFTALTWVRPEISFSSTAPCTAFTST